MTLLYVDKLPSVVRSPFIEKVIEISNYLAIDPNWLMQVMWSESRLNPKAYNPNGGAVGLIQFMPSTARSLGTSSSALMQMDHVIQLEYVKKYYTPFRGKMTSYFDVYLVTFFPAAVGKPDHWVFKSSTLSASLIAKQNPAININKDNEITIAEFKQYLINTVDPAYYDTVFGKKKVPAALIVLAVVGLSFLILR